MSETSPLRPTGGPVPQEPVTWDRAAPDQRPDEERVVVTSWGLVSSLGPDVDSTFDAASEGRSGIDTLTRFDPSGLPCDIGGQVELDTLAPSEPLDDIGGSAWRMLRTAALQADVEGALEGIADRQRIAVILGGHGSTPLTSEIQARARHATVNGAEQTSVDWTALAADPRYQPFLAQHTRRSPDMAPMLLADRVNARGPVVPIVSACAAGTQAIGEGLRMLREGRADAVVSGGAEPFLYYTYVVGFALLGALTRRYPSPQGASRPFDRKRNGFVIAEGAGVVVLERLSDAKRRGRPVLGEILGYGDSADGYRITDLHPAGDGAVRAMQRALTEARVHPDDIAYVNAHGTSTPTNDPVETLAIKRLLGERAFATPVSSNKSMLGHTIGAAGAIEAILTMEGMRRGVVLPTINQEASDRRCDLDYVPNEARLLPHTIALSNSFGFGGQNGCLCLGRGM